MVHAGAQQRIFRSFFPHGTENERHTMLMSEHWQTILSYIVGPDTLVESIINKCWGQLKHNKGDIAEYLSAPYNSHEVERIEQLRAFFSETDAEHVVDLIVDLKLSQEDTFNALMDLEESMTKGDIALCQKVLLLYPDLYNYQNSRNGLNFFQMTVYLQEFQQDPDYSVILEFFRWAISQPFKLRARLVQSLLSLPTDVFVEWYNCGVFTECQQENTNNYITHLPEDIFMKLYVPIIKGSAQGYANAMSHGCSIERLDLLYQLGYTLKNQYGLNDVSHAELLPQAIFYNTEANQYVKWFLSKPDFDVTPDYGHWNYDSSKIKQIKSTLSDTLTRFDELLKLAKPV